MWYQIMEQGYSKVTADANALMTVYAKSGDTGSSSGLYLVSPTDVASRIEYTMSSTQSRLGVSLDNGGWQSKIMSCGKFDSNSTHVHATLGGIGFWEMSHEDAVRGAMRCLLLAVVRGVDAQTKPPTTTGASRSVNCRCSSSQESALMRSCMFAVDSVAFNFCAAWHTTPALYTRVGGAAAF